MVEFINITLNKKDIIYDGKVKKTKKGTGIVRLKEEREKDCVYVIFPIHRRNIGGNIIIAVDEIIQKPIKGTENERCIQLEREYVGRECIIINHEIILDIDKRDIIYFDEVKETYSGAGIVYLHDSFLGFRSYIILPKYIKDNNEDNHITISIDEILNKGIHPATDHTSRALLRKKYVGERCILILQEG